MDLISNNTNNNSHSLIPYLNDIIDKSTKYKIPFAVGMDADGDQLLYGLESCPHLLVAGTTGSGKSVFLNNVILSALCNKECAIALIDIKRVEFSPYKDNRRLCLPVADNIASANNTLINILYEIENRYKLFEKYHCRNITEYKQKIDNSMYYIVLVIDELADIVLQSKVFEKRLIRIAQIARAAGVHVVAATQRPDSKILNGLIRANFPSRVCFKVQNASNSKIVLDRTGAEYLRGCGDGLIFPSGFNNPIRFQSPIISNDDFNSLLNSLKN